MSLANRLFKSLRRTVIQAIPTMAVIILLSFFLLQLAPGDAADVLAGESGSATAETMKAWREHFGLDQTVLQQFINYLDNLAHLSLGFSPRYGMPVADLIMQRLPGTLLLMVLAQGLAIVIGIALGAIMATFVGRLPDRLISILSLIFYSVPAFWIGLMLIVVFSVKLGWLPSGGSGTIGRRLTGMDAVIDKLRYIALPALSLALFYVAIYARLARASILEVLSQDFVRTASAKGLGKTRIILVHVLRNAMIPVTTIAGIHIGNLLGGAVVIETVYSWPGLGRLAFEAVMGRDFAVLLGVMLLSSMVVIAANALVDLIQAWLDPRIEMR